MDIETFWLNVKNLCKLKKISQDTLAEMCLINKATFHNWIYRNISPDVISAFKIANALNTSIEFLVTGEESDSSKNQLLEIKKQLEQMLASLR